MLKLTQILFFLKKQHHIGKELFHYRTTKSSGTAVELPENYQTVLRSSTGNCWRQNKSPL